MSVRWIVKTAFRSLVVMGSVAAVWLALTTAAGLAGKVAIGTAVLLALAACIWFVASAIHEDSF